MSRSKRFERAILEEPWSIWAAHLCAGACVNQRPGVALVIVTMCRACGPGLLRNILTASATP